MTPGRAFFQQPVTDCAPALLGATLTLGATSGKIVETEAYCSATDPACHTFFRKKAREFVEAHPAGTAYVYLNYGVHWMLNFLILPPGGSPGFVLVRALEPRTGLEEMACRRKTARPAALCSGPGKLTAALGIEGSLHGADLLDPGSPLEVELPSGPSGPVLAGPRIGISRAVDFPWRYGLPSPHLSKSFPK